MSHTYGPYGERGTWSEAIFNPWHFAGGYFDASTGLYKFGMRYYDPSIARWTQEDSKTGPNLYLYAGDNPVNNVDPSGRDFWSTLSEIATQGAVCLWGAQVGLYFAIPFLAFAPEVDIFAGAVGCILALSVYYYTKQDPSQLGSPPA